MNRRSLLAFLGLAPVMPAVAKAAAEPEALYGVGPGYAAMLRNRFLVDEDAVSYRATGLPSAAWRKLYRGEIPELADNPLLADMRWKMAD